MTFLRSIFQYPLLGRELTERAARARELMQRHMSPLCVEVRSSVRDVM